MENRALAAAGWWNMREGLLQPHTFSHISRDSWMHGIVYIDSTAELQELRKVAYEHVSSSPQRFIMWISDSGLQLIDA